MDIAVIVKHRLYWRICLSLLAAVAVSAQERNPRTSPADAVAGARIFRSHCAECHGINGEGGKGPDLSSGVYYHGSSDTSLFRNITDGIPGTAMPGQFFSADQIWQVVTHVRALARAGSHTAPKGDPEKGSVLFSAKGCSGCHMVRGEGGIHGPDLSFISSQRPLEFLRQSILEPDAHVAREFWTAEVILESGAAQSGFVMNEDTYYLQMRTRDKGLITLPRKDFRKLEIRKHSVMPSYRGKLADEELTDLISYLWTLKRPAAIQEDAP
jgi:putative heme-binding domain-containing protein